MRQTRKTSANHRILPAPGKLVKARIVGAGILLKDLARAARIQPSTLSDYLRGRISNIHRQIDIHQAFCKLTGTEIALREFWGDLLAREAA